MQLLVDQSVIIVFPTHTSTYSEEVNTLMELPSKNTLMSRTTTLRREKLKPASKP